MEKKLITGHVSFSFYAKFYAFFRVVLLKPGAYEELQRQQTLINSTQKVATASGQVKEQIEEANSDSGNESFENRSSRSSDCDA